jgi:hypothetical protein
MRKYYVCGFLVKMIRNRFSNQKYFQIELFVSFVNNGSTTVLFLEDFTCKSSTARNAK